MVFVAMIFHFISLYEVGAYASTIVQLFFVVYKPSNLSGITQTDSGVKVCPGYVQMNPLVVIV